MDVGSAVNVMASCYYTEAESTKGDQVWNFTLLVFILVISIIFFSQSIKKIKNITSLKYYMQ